MTSDVQKIELCASPEPDLNEEKILSSLDCLQELHLQLRHLRDTVPRIIKPLLAQQPNLEALHKIFSHSVIEAAKDLKEFTKLVESEKTQELLCMAKSRRAENSEGISGWMVTQHEDWLDIRKEDTVTDSITEETVVLTIGSGYNEEIARKILQDFQNCYMNVKASFKDGDFKRIKVNIPAPANMTFEVEMKSDLQGRISFNMTCAGKSRLQMSILEAVSARPNQDDLFYLLEMLASYDNVKSTPCLKCKRLLDSNAQLPVVRQREKTTPAGTGSSKSWQALHRGCS